MKTAAFAPAYSDSAEKAVARHAVAPVPCFSVCRNPLLDLRNLELVVHMQRFYTALFVAVIFSSCWPIHLDAKTVVVKAGWKETRTTLAQPDFRLKLQIQLKSNKKMKGIVTETTGAGLRLERNGSETFIQRTEIHSIRLVPRKASSRRNRVLALAGGLPAGLGIALGAWHFGCAVAGGCGEPSDPVGSAGFYAVLVAVPVVLYKLAARADRGALLIILDDSVANHSLGSPVHRAVVIGEEPVDDLVFSGHAVAHGVQR